MKKEGKGPHGRSRPGKPGKLASARLTPSDVFSKAKRSAVMARIRGAGNRDTELRLIALLRAHGLTGWRRGSTLPGRPDFVFSRAKLAVFVDGCFWHGCPLHATWPKKNAAFWRKKLLANRRRDREVNRLLHRAGWRVLRIWEHALTRARAARTLARLRRTLGGN
ncbi:MAG: very short patch repair endonuclease [Verrucomicrobia bacterium]|nr:very short patch repair endonuclease [Verrucomicrobiota bacterium]